MGLDRLLRLLLLIRTDGTILLSLAVVCCTSVYNRRTTAPKDTNKKENKKSTAKPLHIINFAKIAYHQSGTLCISSLRKRNTAYGWWYTSSVMRYTLKRDDIPLLSQWIKKRPSQKTWSFLVRRMGLSIRGQNSPPDCSSQSHCVALVLLELIFKSHPTELHKK